MGIQEVAAVADTLQSGLGKVRVAEEVVALMAGMAAAECYGLVGMAPRTVQEGISGLLKREDMARGVSVRIEDEEAVIELHVVVQYGVNISQVSRNVMEQVKYAVETLCGLKVKQVNVHVRGVRVPEEAAPGSANDRESSHGETVEDEATW